MERRRKKLRKQKKHLGNAKKGIIAAKKQNTTHTAAAHRDHTLKSVCAPKIKPVCHLLIHAGRSEKKRQCKRAKMKILLRPVTYPAPVPPRNPRSCPPGHQGW